MKWNSKAWLVIRYRSYLLFLPLLIAHEITHLVMALLFMPANTNIQFDFYSHKYLLVTEVRPGAGYKLWQCLIIAAAPGLINLGAAWAGIHFITQAITLGWWWGYVWAVYFIWAAVLCGLSKQDLKQIYFIIAMARNGNNKTNSKSSGPLHPERDNN